MQEKWGKLHELGFPRLLHNVFSAKDTASILDMEAGKIKKRMFFKIGIPVYAISNVLDEVLGRLLVRKGIIAQEVYEKSLEIMLNKKMKQGEVLIANGYITTQQLNEGLSTQVKERLWSVFSWTEGIYHYYNIEKLPKDLFLTPIHPAYAILQAAKRGYYPFEKIRAEVDGKTNNVISRSSNSAYTIDDFQPTPQEMRLLSLIDGKKKMERIIAEAQLSKEDVYSFIYALLVTNVLTPEEIKEKKPEGPSPEDKAVMESLTSKHVQLKSLTHFDILGVSQSANSDEIKRAYFKLAKEYHPDKYHNSIQDARTVASEIFTLINTAYNTLSDEKNRRIYEESLKTGKRLDVTQDAANIMSAELQFQKGKIALTRKDYKGAKDAFEWALKLNPDEGEYKAYLGWTLFNLSPKDRDEMRRAKEIIQEALSSNPNQDRAYYFLGVIYRVEGKLDDAENSFKKAIKRNPNIPEAMSELRLIQMRKKEDKGFFRKIFE